MAIFTKKEEKKAEDKKDATFDPAAFMKSFEAAMGKLANAQTQGFATLANQIAEGGVKKAESPEPPKAADPSDADIDKMTNSQMMKLLLAKVGETVDGKVKPVAVAAEETSNKVDLSEVKKNFEALKSAHPELDHFRGPMKRILTEHPDLVNNLERVLTLAKAESPEIVEKLEEESKTEEAKKSDEETSKAFGGFFPGPTVSVAKDDPAKDSDGNSKDMHSILSDTFDLVMKDVPTGVLSN